MRFENFKNVTMEYNEAAITRADLLGMNTLGESGVLNQGDLSAKVLEGEEEGTADNPQFSGYQ